MEFQPSLAPVLPWEPLEPPKLQFSFQTWNFGLPRALGMFFPAPRPRCLRIPSLSLGFWGKKELFVHQNWEFWGVHG